jgi:hypothetical protein
MLGMLSYYKIRPIRVVAFAQDERAMGWQKERPALSDSYCSVDWRAPRGLLAAERHLGAASIWVDARSRYAPSRTFKSEGDSCL